MKTSVRGKELIVQTYLHENPGVPWVPFAGIHAGRLKGTSCNECGAAIEKMSFGGGQIYFWSACQEP